MTKCRASGCHRVAAKLYGYHWCRAHGGLAVVIKVATDRGWTVRIV